MIAPPAEAVGEKVWAMTVFDTLRASLDPACSYLVFGSTETGSEIENLEALSRLLNALQVDVLSAEICRDGRAGRTYLVIKLQRNTLPAAIHEALYSQLPLGVSYLLFLARAIR